MLQQLLPILILFVIVVGFGVVMLYLTSLAGPKVKQTPERLMPYESGIPGQDPPTTKVPVKFYLTAISFILFDIEVVFLYPWTLVYLENIQKMGGYLLVAMGLFMGILIFGLFYEWKAGGLDWD